MDEREQCAICGIADAETEILVCHPDCHKHRSCEGHCPQSKRLRRERDDLRAQLEQARSDIRHLETACREEEDARDNLRDQLDKLLKRQAPAAGEGEEG